MIARAVFSGLRLTCAGLCERKVWESILAAIISFLTRAEGLHLSFVGPEFRLIQVKIVDDKEFTRQCQAKYADFLLRRVGVDCGTRRASDRVALARRLVQAIRAYYMTVLLSQLHSYRDFHQ